MAEFREVMAQWARMCSVIDNCTKCPLMGAGCWAGSPDAMPNDLSQREEIIIKWAKENPEPVYPTWIDWLRDVGVIPTQEEASRSMRDGVRAASFYVTAKAFSQIPADMVKRLEIKPKEDV